jgi:hypothetical protein
MTFDTSDTTENFLRKCTALIKQCGHSQINGYYSMEDFVLQNGKQWPIGTAKLKLGPAGSCFQTAANYALRWPARYIYCEGFARGIIPFNHAWLLDTGGRVIETVWRDGGVDYFGIAVRYDYLSKALQRQKFYGLIDQPHLKWPMLRDDPKAWRHPIMDL